ncbi:MAG TPA: sugar ABC transporter ATP-binding protein [Atribacteraceae bacterium]|nr:sugar ABC transporter ATP-binding protein [Atribacteraceae bacterium]
MNTLSNPILEFKQVTKRFPGVLALNDVSFSIRRGEVHALVGENGAGKSTLIKIVTGVFSKTSGEIDFEGEPIAYRTPHEALKSGIAAIYQEFNLIPGLTVAENIFMGHHPLNQRKLIDWGKIQEESQKLLDFLNIDIKPDARVKSLGVAKKQVVEIAKALSLKARVLIMDEPTATLAQREIETLFRIIRTLRKEGVTIIYISHRLEEIFEVCDRVSVLRDGKYVATNPVSDIRVGSLIQMMVGKELVEQYPKAEHPIGEEVLRVEDLSRKGVIRNVSFSVRRGEIVGIAGMVGSGRTEVLRAIFGLDKLDSGKVFIRSGEIRITTPRDSIERGIALLPEERKTQGLVLLLSVLDNLGLPNLRRMALRGFINDTKLNTVANEMVKAMNIKTPTLAQRVMHLSGGNQQKVVLGKWFARESDVYLFDEPTRGIDVGAKREIFLLMGKLLERGAGIVMVSSELSEILGMSDRVLVMREGEISGELSRQEMTKEAVLKLALGVEKNNVKSR